MTSPQTQVIARFASAGNFLVRDVSSLKAIVSIGSSLPITTIETLVRMFPGIRIVQDYGMTECGQACSIPFGFTNYASVGRPHRGVKIKFVDRETGKTLGANHTGEIYIKTNQKILGYYKRPDENMRNFTPDGWIISGDAGYFDEDGLIYIVGRYKDIIKTDGVQVSPKDLESLLLEEGLVAEAAVVGVPDAERGEVAWAFLVPRDKSSTPTQKVIYSVNGKLSDYKHIRRIIWVEKLPVIGIGKVDRKSLREKAAAICLESGKK
jgi:acyl-coenzyme A synthetase/AMP-(fatty) acid ligase